MTPYRKPQFIRLHITYTYDVTWHHRIQDKLLIYHLYVLVPPIIRSSIKFWERMEGIASVTHLVYCHSVTDSSEKLSCSYFKDFKSIPQNVKLEEALPLLLLSFGCKQS